MKPKIFFIAAIVLCMAAFSCSKSKGPYTGWDVSEHYIQTYFNISKITAGIQASQQGVINISYDAVEFRAGGEYDYQFGKLAERYNDFGYNRSVQNGMYKAVSNEFKSMDVISDHDFNDIPAGESLAGVVKLLSSSAKHYIESKYTEEYDWDKDFPKDYIVNGERLVTEYFDPGFWPVYGTLDSLDPAELVLLHWAMLCLTFTETPAVKEHNLTITLSDAANDFSCELAYTFD